MPSLVQLRKTLEASYGFAFPEDLYAFHDLLRTNAGLCAALELVPEGPLAALAGDRSPAGRYYNDPPELVTVLGGHTDGLHWGYWFDHPGKLEPVVVSCHANDAFELTVDGATLFEAVRAHLEALHRDAEEYARDDVKHADAYRARLEAYATARAALAASSELLRKRREVGGKYLDKHVHTTKPRTRRRPVAATRSKIGIVVEAKQYRPLARKDEFQGWSYLPQPAEVSRLVAAAREATEAGFPGTALKLGHDLWIYQDHQQSAYEMLELAYGALGRDLLRPPLARAIAFRQRCDETAAKRRKRRR